MKKQFIKIAKENGYLISDYKCKRSDMGMVCFEFACTKGDVYFIHYESYPFGSANYGGRDQVIKLFSDRLKSINPEQF